MSTQNLVHSAIEKIEGSLNNDPVLSILSARVLSLVGESIEQLKENTKDAERLASLSDEQLLSEVVLAVSSKRAMVGERELRKQKRRLEAKQQFFATLREYGGLYKAGDISKKLGVSRQTVNNQRKNGKLLSINNGGDYLFPAFQFGENKKLENIEMIFAELEGISSITQCSFFINKIELLGEILSPLELLERGVNDNELALLIREASLFGTSVSS